MKAPFNELLRRVNDHPRKRRVRLIVAITLVSIIISLGTTAGTSSARAQVNAPVSLWGTLELNRSQAYYLGPIPSAGASSLLSFTWNASFPVQANGTGTLQFSSPNSAWSALTTFSVVNGQAGGSQPIDSSWARPGANYIQATFRNSLTPQTTLSVYVNYSTTVIAIILPIILIPVAAAILITKRRKRLRQKRAID